jgi:hypothetical protein
LPRTPHAIWLADPAIVGSGTNEIGSIEGYVLCLPSPSAMGLLVAAIAHRRRAEIAR